MELVLERQGECVKMESHGGSTHMEFYIPARGLIGLRTRMLTATQGTAIMHHNFYEYRPLKAQRRPGRATGVYHLDGHGEGDRVLGSRTCRRGILFVAPQDAGVRGPDRRRALPRQRPGGERDPGEAADQHAGVRQRQDRV